MTEAAESVLREHIDGAAIDTSDAVYRYAAAGAVPGCVVQPADPAGVAAIVSAARAAGLALIPAGHPTHLDVGAAPRAYDVALSTRRMNRILAHDAGDMTVTAEAGVSLSELAAVLAAQGQWLPLDPSRAADMTVGGLIAADRNGPLRCAHGTVRDWLLGVKVVLADGELLKGGGRVVKNVAGYDLPKLFAGSFGTLGVLVEATFKVRPLPEREALFLWPARDLAAALGQARATTGAGVYPTLLEVLNESAAETLGLDAGAAVVVGGAGAAPHLDEQERRLQALSAGHVERVAEDRMASLRRALSDFSQPANDDGVVLRLSALPTVLAALVPEIEAAAQAQRLVAEIAVHAASGVAWCQLLGALDPAPLGRLALEMRALARRRGAWAVFETLPAELRGEIDPWGFDAPALRLMAGVKRALDPSGLFSPGRFVGGI
jgi:glycolate oxidase FAD binding subunit